MKSCNVNTVNLRFDALIKKFKFDALIHIKSLISPPGSLIMDSGIKSSRTNLNLFKKDFGSVFVLKNSARNFFIFTNRRKIKTFSRTFHSLWLLIVVARSVHVTLKKCQVNFAAKNDKIFISQTSLIASFIS